MKSLKNTFSLFTLLFTLIASPIYATGYSEYSTTEDKEAQFPGGKEKMQQWIKENLRFPQENIRYGIVRIEVTIKKSGKPTGFVVKKGINEDMDLSAVECLQGMPYWEPAVQDGKKVNSVVIIPVKFSSEDNK